MCEQKNNNLLFWKGHKGGEKNNNANNNINNAIQIAPNPLNSESIINVNAEENKSSLKIYNSLGQVVKNISLSKGNNNITISASDFSNGVYYCIVENGDGKIMSESKKLVVFK